MSDATAKPEVGRDDNRPTIAAISPVPLTGALILVSTDRDRACIVLTESDALDFQKLLERRWNLSDVQSL